MLQYGIGGGPDPSAARARPQNLSTIPAWQVLRYTSIPGARGEVTRATQRP